MASSTRSDQSVNEAVSDAANAEAVEAATRQPAGEGIAVRLAERLGSVARAAAVFGEPVTREGVTVIPVARARAGFGGGSGGDAEHGSGEGRGGGVLVTPIGWIEISDAGSRFRPLVNRLRWSAGTIAGTAVLGAILLRGRRPAAQRGWRLRMRHR
jgi:Sporulation protein YtfJ (Spore_YtfJ)